MGDESPARPAEAGETEVALLAERLDALESRVRRAQRRRFLIYSIVLIALVVRLSRGPRGVATDELHMLDAGGTLRASVQSDNQAVLTVRLYGENDAACGILTVSGGENPEICLFDARGATVWRTPAGLPDGGPGVREDR